MTSKSPAQSCCRQDNVAYVEACNLHCGIIMCSLHWFAEHYYVEFDHFFVKKSYFEGDLWCTISNIFMYDVPKHAFVGFVCVTHLITLVNFMRARARSCRRWRRSMLVAVGIFVLPAVVSPPVWLKLVKCRINTDSSIRGFILSVDEKQF